MELIIVGGIVGLLGVLSFIAMPAFRVVPYVYGASRLRAARANLMNLDELKSLAYGPYENAIFELEEKKHIHLLDLIDEDFREELVQKKIRQRYLEELNKIIRYTPAKYKGYFKLLRSHESLEFLISVLRSKMNPYHSRHMVADLFVGTPESKELVVSGLEEMSLDEFLEVVKRTRYKNIVERFQDKIKNGELMEFEAALNAEYYRLLLANAKDASVLRQFTKRQIDIHNVRVASYFTEKKHEFVTGGSFGEEILSNLKKAKNVVELKNALSDTYMAEFLVNAETVVDVIRGLFASLKKYADNIVMRDPLSLNQMVAFFIHKLIETKNLRILLKLIFAKFEPKFIEERLI